MTDWKTKLIHPEVTAPEGFRSLVEPTHRGSTVLFDRAGDVAESRDPWTGGYAYGLYGTPTTLELAGRVCALEGGHRTVIVSSGQNAIALVNLALLKAGDHVLLPESVYGPSRKLAATLLRGWGITHDTYDPLIGAGIAAHLRPETRLVWCESPGSITMEVQDVPAIVRAAHAHGALVAIDHTWSAGVYFDAFRAGVDVAVQALTKYVAGHSDILLGSVTVATEALRERVQLAQQVLGQAASPDDCQLALRGMRTMAVRLAEIGSATLEIARWLAARDEVEQVLHPALASCPGHEIWKRDFSGSSGVFSIVFRKGVTKTKVEGFVDALRLFQVGYSWGGVASLALSYDLTGWHGRPEVEHRLVRLSIGLEDRHDLLADLEQALRATMG